MKKIECIQEYLARDEKFAAVQRWSNRPRRDSSRIDDHVTLPMEYYFSIARTFIRAVLSIRFNRDGSSHLASVRKTTSNGCGFNPRHGRRNHMHFDGQNINSSTCLHTDATIIHQKHHKCHCLLHIVHRSTNTGRTLRQVCVKKSV